MRDRNFFCRDRKRVYGLITGDKSMIEEIAGDLEADTEDVVVDAVVEDGRHIYLMDGLFYEELPYPGDGEFDECRYIVADFSKKEVLYTNPETDRPIDLVF